MRQPRSYVTTSHQQAASGRSRLHGVATPNLQVVVLDLYHHHALDYPEALANALEAHPESLSEVEGVCALVVPVLVLHHHLHLVDLVHQMHLPPLGALVTWPILQEPVGHEPGRDLYR